jgi:hypothetical protein
MRPGAGAGARAPEPGARALPLHPTGVDTLCAPVDYWQGTPASSRTADPTEPAVTNLTVSQGSSHEVDRGD